MTAWQRTVRDARRHPNDWLDMTAARPVSTTTHADSGIGALAPTFQNATNRAGKSGHVMGMTAIVMGSPLMRALLGG